MTPEEVLEEVLKDDGFYSRSGGGLMFKRRGTSFAGRICRRTVRLGQKKQPDQRHRDDRMRFLETGRTDVSPSGRDPL